MGLLPVTSMLRNAVLLDRDGVINRDFPDYIKSWEEFEFLPGSIDAIADLTRNGRAVFIISNQSAVGRRLMPRAELDRIFSNMCGIIESRGGRITDIFYCPHRPEDNCDCRKPEPGLIFQAQEKYDIELATAVMVGDSVRDIACARNAGCGGAVLVESGYEKIDPETLQNADSAPDHIASDLRHAVDWLLRHPAPISAAHDNA